jgi:hypothetical protein
MTTTEISSKELASFLDGLFGSEAKVDHIEPPSSLADPRVTATYNNAEGGLEFAIICELKLANSLGAALAMIPPGGAEDASAEGVIPENIGENLYEVLNILSAAFADAEHHRVVLDKVFHPDQPLEADLAAKVDAAQNLIQIEYETGRYQAGKMSLLKI